MEMVKMVRSWSIENMFQNGVCFKIEEDFEVYIFEEEEEEEKTRKANE